jgi:hypothetical protein
VQEEGERLREENARLQAMLGFPESAEAGMIPLRADISEADSSKSGGDLSTPEGKISLSKPISFDSRAVC